jgi:hypothetical protein
MAHVPIFHGVVSEDGERVLFASDEKPARRSYLRQLAGERIEWTVRKERTQRSLDQNALIHVIATVLSDCTGYTLAESKLLMMGECFGWKTVSGHEMPVKPHTADMTVEEATYFIDWALPWLHEQFPHARLPREAA